MNTDLCKRLHYVRDLDLLTKGNLQKLFTIDCDGPKILLGSFAIQQYNEANKN